MMEKQNKQISTHPESAFSSSGIIVVIIDPGLLPYIALLQPCIALLQPYYSTTIALYSLIIALLQPYHSLMQPYYSLMIDLYCPIIIIPALCWPLGSLFGDLDWNMGVFMNKSMYRYLNSQGLQNLMNITPIVTAYHIENGHQIQAYIGFVGFYRFTQVFTYLMAIF